MENILKFNFEYRVIISYAIFGIALLTLFFSKEYTYFLIADAFSVQRGQAEFWALFLIGIVNLIAWIFRSYAGGYLSGHTIVTKSVQTSKLVTGGPYAYVRNPLYVSDIIAMTVVGFAGPPVAVLILFFGKIITSYMYAFYEEKHLEKKWGTEYQIYKRNVPRFFPRLSPFKKSNIKVKINWKEGLAYNFYAMGIGLAFLIAAFSHNRMNIFLFGFITPILWFFLRFIDRHIRKIVK
ncbi:MAG: isoprenylcysteine carboxylmethyltransferase family protein [archaeon]